LLLPAPEAPVMKAISPLLMRKVTSVSDEAPLSP